MSFNEMNPRPNVMPAAFHDPVMPNFLALSYDTSSPLLAPTGLGDALDSDDMDIMLLHADFPKIIELTAFVKRARQVLNQALVSTIDVRSPLPWDDVLQVVSRMQDTHLRDPHTPRESIERGRYPIMDLTVDLTLKALQQEWDDLTQRIDDLSRKKQGRATKKDAIAVKYSFWQTSILMKWMINHIEDPFPSPDDVKSLMQQAGLTHSQVVNWTTNVRKRNRKATCEGTKKPHHFVDFMFLVQNREEKKKAATGGVASSPRSASLPPTIRSSGRVTRKRSAQVPTKSTAKPPPTAKAYPKGGQSTAKPPPTARAYPKGDQVSKGSSILKKAPKAKAPSKRKGNSKRNTEKDEAYEPVEPMRREVSWLTVDNEADSLSFAAEDRNNPPLTREFPVVFHLPLVTPSATLELFPETPPTTGPTVFPEVDAPEGSAFLCLPSFETSLLTEEIGDFTAHVGAWVPEMFFPAYPATTDPAALALDPASQQAEVADPGQGQNAVQDSDHQHSFPANDVDGWWEEGGQMAEV